MLKGLVAQGLSRVHDAIVMYDLDGDFVFYVLLKACCVFLLVFVSIKLCYYYVFRGVYTTTKKSTFDNKSTRFERMRKTTFPPPYPNGWFRVCHLSDLDDGNIISFTGLGHDLVIFKGQLDENDLSDIETSNSHFYDPAIKIGALHAFCPHIGAHLGQGGKVVGDRVSCPFHGWQFDATGRVRVIPYLPAQNSTDPGLLTEFKKKEYLEKLRAEGKDTQEERTEDLIPGNIPEICKTKSYETCIWNGVVFVWFDAEGRPPHYSLYETPHLELARMKAIGDKRYEEVWSLNQKKYAGTDCKKDFLEEWRYIGMCELEFTMHIAEMAENSADYFHFNYLHAPLAVPILGRFFHTSHDNELFFNAEKDKHICYFKEWTDLYFLKHWRVPGDTTETLVTFEGPSVVHFELNTPLGKVYLVKTIVPLEPFKVHCIDEWYCQKHVPYWYGKVISWIGKGALLQDKQVWENKTFNAKPVLVKGDGPFPAHRRWFKQFYSDSSKDVGKDMYDW